MVNRGFVECRLGYNVGVFKREGTRSNVVINELEAKKKTKRAEVFQMCSLMEMKVTNMSVVGIATAPAKQKQHQHFKCRYSENVIHWELEHLKC